LPIYLYTAILFALAGKRAEIFGGLVLIAVGCVTLWEHLQ